jgi:hypothetical protein
MMQRTVSRNSIAAVLAACVMVAAAKQPPEGRQDPQSSYEPRSKPGSGQKYLERMVDQWEVQKTFYPREGEPVRTSGRCRQVMVQNGRFLQSDFVFGQGGQESTGMGLIGYEPEAGRFTSVWIDSRQTRMSLRYSRQPFDGEKIMLYSGTLETSKTDTRSSRTISILEDKDNRLVHRQYAIGPNGDERLMMELVLIRSH